ncbi:hypothetical protein K2173_024327 [Erythroxylum novogranatense]|uniref:Uncharacterized protein n=1 Tax=Erythroxylum novogranatense TaxID=1862640 RepID=A0AAV8SUQ7_9ROSI|nr:hypothetical protein K2173_024327 [Erythroxylum novogranatense]
MNTQQRQVIVRDLVEEAKKRIVILGVCVVGLSYLMSLTSSSVWVNLPAAASLIILLRYFSLDYEMRRKAAAYNSSKPASISTLSPNKPVQSTRVIEKREWRRKVNSPVVEDAIDHFARRIVAEWVTDLWYSRLTPDKDGPEELVHIMHGVIGEISRRMRSVNLIDLLTRNLIDLTCSHLELFRATQGKIEKQQARFLTIEERNKELRHVLASENKLHPALFSTEAEHKVLQHLMDGLISFTFRSEDLQCAFFRYIVRELLACAVVRPVLNLANPRFINERIEIFVMSRANRGVAAQEGTQTKANESSRVPSDHFCRFLDPKGTGVELVQFKNDQSRNETSKPEKENVNGTLNSKDPLLSIDTRSSRSWNSLPMNSPTSQRGGIIRHTSGGEWGDMLDMMSQRKTAALAPENFENMWAKGRNYQNKEGKEKVIEQVRQNSSITKAVPGNHSKKFSRPKEQDGVTKIDPPLAKNIQSVSTFHPREESHVNQNMLNNSLCPLDDDDEENINMRMGEAVWGSSDSHTSESEDGSSVTGLDSPVTKVWDGKTNRNLSVSHIHHPLENLSGYNGKKTGRGHSHHQRLSTSQSGRKRSRPSTQRLPVWQEIERTSFYSGDGQDILSAKAKADDSSDDSEVENMSRLYSGATASSSAPSISIPGDNSRTVNSLKSSMMLDSFFRLRCEVLGANIVRSGSRTFAVYSISVTDVNNNSWSIKRRFRHFEELHRRLKEYPEYSLHLPPKHFLSTGLDVPVIQERCKLLDRYLKKLLQLPTISGSIEVWDFLSVDSQTYVFSNSFSIIETLSVDLDNKPSQTSRMVSNNVAPVLDPISSNTCKEHLGNEWKESAIRAKNNCVADGLRMNTKDSSHSLETKVGKDTKKLCENSGSDSDTQKNALYTKNLEKIVKGRVNASSEEKSESLHDAATDTTLPRELVPPNLSGPVLDLVDVVFQLQDGGWIRRKAFWVAKQLLQLGMGDALDDWLLEKIQLLRKGTVVASGIKRVEKILWPDGIFITKHPKRRRQTSANTSNGTSLSQQSTEMSTPKGSTNTRETPEMSSPRLNDDQVQQEADRRAKFVYELMIDNAPAAIVGLVGRREYQQCAKDLYFFLQSPVCLKQLAFELLELLLLSAFPEMDSVLRQLHEEKQKFGEFKDN